MVDERRSPFTPASSITASAGSLASAAWLSARGLSTPSSGRWSVEVALDVAAGVATFAFNAAVATRFHLSIHSADWGYYVCRGSRASSIRVRDVAIAERDDHALLSRTPPLRDIARLLRELERRWNVTFQRALAAIETDLAGAEPVIRGWLASL